MDLNISLAPDILFSLAGFPVTNTLLWSVVLSVFLMLFFVLIARSAKLIPGRWQNFIELLVDGSYSFVESITGPGEKAKRVFPLVFTMFIFTLVANLAVYIPGQAAITVYNGEGFVPVFRAVMSDYGLVLIMTLISVLVMQIVAIITAGPWKYLGRFINLKNPLAFFLGLMELVGELAKIISLSFRLFGNIFAGEVLGSVILFLAPFFMPLPFQFLGLLSAVVQAFVFSVLTLVFISMASEMPAEEEAKV
ncbi:MAG: F0F1 ATP synthase subunit A [Candidatus Pacebacteria bacterium]|nr:F0F1 ATP synthase subunit A [Candidatus Paceibacterota bacterium]